MRNWLGASLLACIIAAAVASQAGSAQSASSQDPQAPQGSQAPQAATKKQPTKDVTLVGCVGGDNEAPGQFTLSEAKEGTTYRLSGTNMREYSGHRVQIVGTPASGRFHIAGGLVPSANAAAQAGALDPARSAREAASGTGGAAGSIQLPEFRVKRVRPVSGECP